MDVRTKTVGRGGLRWTVGPALTWPGPTRVQLEKVEVLVAVALSSRVNQRSGEARVRRGGLATPRNPTAGNKPLGILLGTFGELWAQQAGQQLGDLLRSLRGN